MSSETVIVTGASGGIGSALAEELAGLGFRVILACRNAAKAMPVRDRIVRLSGNHRVEVRMLDLASFESICDFAATAAAEGLRLRLLINNAGVMCGRFGRTAEGFEQSIGVNYLGTVLLTRLLLPLLDADARVVNTVSVTRKMGRIDDSFFTADGAGYSRFRAYANSKLALTLFTWSLAERLGGRSVVVQAADPGVVNTNMIAMQRWFDPLADRLFRPLIKSPRQGAEAALSAAFLPAPAGSLFRGGRVSPLPLSVRNHPRGEWLWQETERLFRQKGVLLPEIECIPADPAR